MGTLRLIKANFGSILTQLEAALAKGDTETVKELISQSVVKILKAGLTQHQRQNLDPTERD
jgi:hypothetical protein